MKFNVGHEASQMFKYIGLHVEQNCENITMHQNDYINSISDIDTSLEKYSRNSQELNAAETKSLRTMVGQLGWVSTQTRPDIAFDFLELSTSLKSPTVENIKLAHKCMKKMKSQNVHLTFPDIGDISKSKLVVYCDASHANLPDGVSSAQGHIVFLVGENEKSCPILWESKKIKRVVKSTLAAEALSLSEAIDSAEYVGFILSEIVLRKSTNVIPIECYVDNYSLFENLYSTKSVSEKRLRIDIASIKEKVQKENVSVKWIESSKQISDCLTKRGANPYPLLNVIQTGILNKV